MEKKILENRTKINELDVKIRVLNRACAEKLKEYNRMLDRVQNLQSKKSNIINENIELINKGYEEI